MCSCHSILECCVMFSGVKLSMGSFVLFGRNLRRWYGSWIVELVSEQELVSIMVSVIKMANI